MSGLKEAGHSAMRDALTSIDSSADDLIDMRSSTPLPHFPIAIVEDVYYDPLTQIDEETLEFLKTLGSPELAERIPRNTILARIVSRGVDKSDSEMKLFFPANPYDGQPVKPGESVFIFYSDPYSSMQIGFWWCRVPEPMDTDDINFTHADRKFEYNQDFTTIERFNTDDTANPGFPNGGGTEESLTTANEDDFERINEEASALEVVVKEPVARFTKRPGDRVLQGSNGTRVVLGQERRGPAEESPSEQSPAIDIVATSYEFSGDDEDPQGSAPRVVSNTRGEREADKNPKKKNGSNNIAEGDPNFEKDQVRLYMSAKTDVDSNFNIEIDGIEPSEAEKSAAALKGDQIRLIARQNLKIVIEGNDEGSGTSIIMDGNNITIIPGSDGVVSVGIADADQRQVRGNDLMDWINEKIIKAVQGHAHPTAMGPTGAPIPDPANPPIGADGPLVPFRAAKEEDFLSTKATVE